MSSKGIQAWSKYFQGKGDLPTTMKIASSTYDADNPNKKIGEIAAGTKIIYLKTAKFEQRALIQIDNNKKELVRVPFDNITKPASRASAAASLKPQAFGVAEKKYTLTQYTKIIKDSIEERTDLSVQMKTFLSTIFAYCSGENISKSEVSKIFSSCKADIPLNDITKDFGEVLGPVALYHFKLLSKTRIVLPSNMLIFFPRRPNEPLMDYGIYTTDTQYIFSAKSGKKANTVKTKDVIELLSKDPKKITKWGNTPQFKILKTLSENSILVGPIKAVAEIHPDLISPNAVKNIVNTSSDLTGLSTFIKKNQYLKNVEKPTLNEIMYECEKIIQAETKSGDLNMNDIFADAIEEKVLYLKFDLDSSGLPKWEIVVSDDIRRSEYGRIFLRTKNSYKRAEDKLGIDI